MMGLLGAAGIGGGLGGPVVGQAVVQMTGDTARLQKDFATAEGQTRASTTSMGQSVSRFSTATKVAMIAGAAAVLKFTIDAVKGWTDFDAKMTESLAIMGDVSDGMRAKMERAAREVAKTTTFSASQAAESYFFLASAGLDAEASVMALDRVAKFAQAGMFDMALATDLLTDAQSALGLTIRDDAVANMENMTRVADVLVKANTLANATVEQFSESLTNRAAAALRTVNKDVEEGVAVLAAFADQGVKGSKAGEQLNIVMRDLQRSAINNKEAFEEAGVAVFDSEGNMNNLGDIVADLEGATAGLSDEQKRLTFTTLGLQEKSLAAMLQLIGTSDAIKRYERELRNAAGTTDEVAAKQLESFQAQLSLLWSRVQDVALSVGRVLVPVLGTLATALGVVVSVVGPFVEILADILSALSDIHPLLPILAAGFAIYATRVGLAAGANLVFAGSLNKVGFSMAATQAASVGAAAGAMSFTRALGPIGLAVGTLVVGAKTLGDVFVNELTPERAQEFTQHLVNQFDKGKLSTDELREAVEKYNIIAEETNGITPLTVRQIEKLVAKKREASLASKEQAEAEKAAQTAMDASIASLNPFTVAVENSGVSVRGFNALTGESFQEMVDTAQKALAEGEDGLIDFVKETTEALDKWRTDAVVRFNGVAGSLGELANKQHLSADKIERTFKRQLKDMEEWGKNWETVSERGGKKADTFLAAIQEMGLEGGGILAAMAETNDKQFGRIIGLWDEGEGGAVSLTRVIERDLVGSIDKLIDALKGIPGYKETVLDLDTAEAMAEAEKFNQRMQGLGINVRMRPGGELHGPGGPAVRQHQGGKVRRGPGGGPNERLIMAEVEEFVVRADRARRFQAILEAINSGMVQDPSDLIIPEYHVGGRVKGKQGVDRYRGFVQGYRQMLDQLKLSAEVKTPDFPDFAPIGGAGTAGLNAKSLRALAAISGTFPYAYLLSGFRPGAIVRGTNTPSQHGIGNAIDVGSRIGHSALWNVWDWLMGGWAQALSARYMVLSAAGRPPLQYSAGSGLSTPSAINTADHFNHIHMDFLRRGGHARRTGPAMVHSGEQVLPLGDERAVEHLANAMGRALERLGNDGQVVVNVFVDSERITQKQERRRLLRGRK